MSYKYRTVVAHPDRDVDCATCDDPAGCGVVIQNITICANCLHQMTHRAYAAEVVPEDEDFEHGDLLYDQDLIRTLSGVGPSLDLWK